MKDLMEVVVVSSQAMEVLYINNKKTLVKPKLSRKEIAWCIVGLSNSDKNGKIVYNEVELPREFIYEYYPDGNIEDSFKGLLADYQNYLTEDED